MPRYPDAPTSMLPHSTDWREAGLDIPWKINDIRGEYVYVKCVDSTHH